MFSNCLSLVYIDLSNFIFEKIKNMSNIFNNCTKLPNIKMDLYNSKVRDIDYMFSNCESLGSLELINFNMSNLLSFNHVFDSCKKLEYINMTKSTSSKNVNISNDPFEDIVKNAVICIEQNQEMDNLYNYINNSNSKTINCSQNWKNAKKKYFNNKYYDYVRVVLMQMKMMIYVLIIQLCLTLFHIWQIMKY